jgi:hypothetical protein
VYLLVHLHDKLDLQLVGEGVLELLELLLLTLVDLQ